MQTAIKLRPAAPTIADFTLKAVKTFRGMEGEQYEAKIVLEGKTLAHVWDDGWGGCLNVDYSNPEAEKFLTEWCKAQPAEIADFNDPKTGKPYEHNFDIETLANKLMDAWHDAKEAKRWEKLARENVMFKLKGDREDGWRSIKLKQPSGHVLAHATIKQIVREKHGDKLERFYGE